MLSFALLLPASAYRSDLTVVNSLGPVQNNETVVSFVPNYHPVDAAPQVKLCGSAGFGCKQLPTMRHAAGVVHWVLDAPLDEYTYSLCLDGTCGPPAQLNSAELWWFQCVGTAVAKGTANAANGLECGPGRVLRLFGKGLAFAGARCAPYAPYVHGAETEEEEAAREEREEEVFTNAAAASLSPPSRPPSMFLRLTLAGQNAGSSTPIELASATHSCYDATFALPASLVPGSYTLEVKSNLPSATWQLARDPDQHALVIAAPLLPEQQCDSASKTLTANSAASLKQALAAARARKGGATVVVEGTIVLGNADMLTVPNCTVLQGKDREARLRWHVDDAIGVDCAQRNTFLVGVAGVSITVQDLEIEAVALRGCAGIVGGTGTVGLTLRNLNITAFADMGERATFASPVHLQAAQYFLVEGCSFLHCGNNTPGDEHSGVNSPILSIDASSNGVLRNNLWMVGLSGWHIDTSFHIVMESNVFTGYIDNDVSRPLPNFDGSFWFSSYRQGPFPGAGRFFYANTTQNERAHTKPQVGGGESFTLDGGNSGGYYGGISKVDSDTLTLSDNACWQTVGGYSIANCSTAPAVPGGKTGHAVQIIKGPSKGQWRRIVGISGPEGRVIRLDAPFEPSPVISESILQIGPMRGQVSIVGNHFVKGGGVQLYAACYDCLVAENRFDAFGFANWGRNPHGPGWQPNLNNVMVDNTLTQRGMSVRGCTPTCSASYGSSPESSAYAVTPCSSIGSGGGAGSCSGNATSLFGRDCTPFEDDPTHIGSYQGAINLQLAWRRNMMSADGLTFISGAQMAGKDLPLVDGGIIEGNFNAAGGPIAVSNLNGTANILLVQ